MKSLCQTQFVKERIILSSVDKLRMSWNKNQYFSTNLQYLPFKALLH